MKNKGFTLVELLAVISIMGVVMIIFIPMTLNALKNGKKLLNEYSVGEVEEAGKLYITDLDEGIVDYTYTGDESVEVLGHTYQNGDTISGYDLKVFIINQGGIYVDMKTLVEGGYYDKECKYAGTIVNGKALTEDQNCHMPSTCILKVGIDYKMSNDGVYYVTTGYTSSAYSGCE